MEISEVQKALKGMTLKLIPVSKINPAPYNPRERLLPGDPDYESLKRSISEHTLVDPLIWNSYTGTLVGGHQRFYILVDEFKVKEIPCIVLFIKDLKREMAINLGLNKIRGRFDHAKLKEVFLELSTDELLADTTGFDSVEREQVLMWEPKNTNIDTVGKTPNEALHAFNSGTIKQIVLYYSNEDYQDRIRRLEQIGKNIGQEDNTSIVDNILEFYEDAHRPVKTS